MIEELAWAQKAFPQVKEFFFDDDTLTDNLPRVEALAREIGKLGIVWSCNAKANVPRATLKVLKDNGLRLLLVGYESGNQQILHNIKKGMRVDVARRFAKDCRELGIVIHGTFILGLPGETKETIEETIRFAIEINPHTIQVSLAAPYPGTFLYKQAQENDWFAHENADMLTDRGVQLASLSYPHLSHTEIFQSVDAFYRRFYFRAPKIAAIAGEMVQKPRHIEAPAARGRRVLPLPARAPGARALKRVVVTADDFGLAREVNEAVEAAHQGGVLTAASLMVGAPAAQDAIARARRLPRLRVGLHLVLVEGRPVLPPQRLPDLVDATRAVPQRHGPVSGSTYSRVLRSAGSSRRRSRRSSRPIVRPASRSITSMRTSIFTFTRPSPPRMIAIGRVTVCADCGCRSSRPAFWPRIEPSAPTKPGRSGRAMGGAARAAVHGGPACGVPDAVFGLAWSGAMTQPRLSGLLRHLPKAARKSTCTRRRPTASRAMRPVTATPTSLLRSWRRRRSRPRAVPTSRWAAIAISDPGAARISVRSAQITGLLEPGDRIRDGLAIRPRAIAELAPCLRVAEEHVMARHAQPIDGRERRLAGQARP